jgi:hypothetical protein
MMRRRKRFTILRIALGFALAAMVPAIAQAKPQPAWPDVEEHGSYQLGPGEIPYLDQTFHPQSVTPTPVASDDGGASLDLNVYTATGLSLALALALSLGMGLTVWYYRNTKLLPS